MTPENPNSSSTGHHRKSKKPFCLLSGPFPGWSRVPLPFLRSPPSLPALRTHLSLDLHAMSCHSKWTEAAPLSIDLKIQNTRS